MENLATIQTIKNVRSHLNANTLDLASVLGWQVVTKRDQFKSGDMVIYVCIDTVLPDKPEFEFLRNKSFRIKPIHLRGEESAGIVFPTDILPSPIEITEGTDVTDMLGVKKYDKPIPVELQGEMIGAMPGIIIQTDEKNLRTWPVALEELYGRPYYITRKDDGTSGTFYTRGSEFCACGRTIQYVDSETNGFWKMARKYSIADAIRRLFPNRDIALQGEVVGPGIQQNHLGLTEMEFHLFNIFDIHGRYYYPYDQTLQFCADTSIPMVPVIAEGSSFPHTLAELIALADSLTYPGGLPAEGIVVRPKEPFYSSVLKKAWSGKILNTRYEEMMEKKKQDKREKRQQNAREAQNV